jgi:hypothetical protein
MKKIFTLFVVAAGLFATAQAQPGNRDGNRRDDDRRDDIKVVVNHNDPYDRDGFGNSHFSNDRRMRMQVAQINREYDFKIQKVRNNYFMSRWEKQRLMRSLEDQRQRELRIVYAKFRNNGRYNDHDDRDRRRY